MGAGARFNLTTRSMRGPNGERIDPYSVILDRFGRPLSVGDVILYSPTMPVSARLTRMVPVLDPGAPPNLVTIEYVAKFQFHVPKGQPLTDLVLLGTTEEAVPEAPPEGTEPPPAEPPLIVVPGSEPSTKE